MESKYKVIQAAKDLQIKQLAETLVIGNCFSTQEEHSDNYDIGRNNYDISNQNLHGNSEDVDEQENAGRSISSIADEIMSLDIPADNPGSDEQVHHHPHHHNPGSDEQGLTRHCTTVRSVRQLTSIRRGCGSTPEVNMEVLCIPVSTAVMRQHGRAILRLINNLLMKV